MEAMLAVSQGIDRILQRIASVFGWLFIALVAVICWDVITRKMGFPATRVRLDADPGTGMASARHAVPVLAGLRLCAQRACAHRRVHRPPALAPAGLAGSPRHRHLCNPLQCARDLLLVVFRRGVVSAEREFRRAERARATAGSSRVACSSAWSCSTSRSCRYCCASSSACSDRRVSPTAAGAPAAIQSNR